jgi:uncharacterized protein with NRDE domain
MCTLVIAFSVWPGIPLVVAANRDELLTRPAEGFGRREVGQRGPGGLGGTGVLAPRDLLSGGTWLGLNGHGVFVAITNRAGLPPDPDRRSRGLLVHDALAHDSAVAASKELGSIDPGDYNPFHLVMADRDQAHLVWCDGKTVHGEELSAGMHVITERSFDAAPTRRPGRVSEMLSELSGQPYPGAVWFQRMLATTDPATPLEGVCVVFTDGEGSPGGQPYGTRSSTVLELHEDPGETLLLDHQGPPRVVDGAPDDGWTDLSADARTLLAGG